MADDNSDREAALLELRRDMLNFIVEEIALRVDAGNLPVLEGRLEDIIRERAQVALTDALRESRLVDAQAVAQEVVKILRRGKAGETEKTKESVQAPPPAEDDKARHPMRLGNPNPDGEEAGFARLFRRLRYWAGRQGLPAAVIILFLASLALGVLYVDKGIALDRARGQTDDRSKQLAAVCGIKRQLEAEAALLRDDERWRSLCKDGAEDQERSRICLSEARLRALPGEFQKNCP